MNARIQPMLVTYYVSDDAHADGEERTLALPQNWVICDVCAGTGSYGMPEWQARRVIGGNTCSACKGDGKVLVVDDAAIEARRAWDADFAADLAACEAWWESYNEDAACMAAERRAGA